MPLNESLREQLTSLVTAKPVVLFMKGNRQFPQCGFSSQVVAVLNELVPGYETVNVLSDASVREGVKEFTGWPTIPQLFVGGEFVGGCDIVKAMHASGELKAMLDAKGIATKGASTQPTATPGAPSITVTPAAARAFQSALAGAPGERLRFSIGPRFDYDLAIGPAQPDDVVTLAGSLTLYVDPSSAAQANGTVIDFIDGPDGGFKIENPNEPARVRPLTVRELKTMLDQNVPLSLFDVRTEGERQIAKLDAARPFDARAEAEIENLPKDAILVFHCHHGGRSQAAAERFAAQGYRNVYNVTGGIDAWSLAIDPSVARY